LYAKPELSNFYSQTKDINERKSIEKTLMKLVDNKIIFQQGDLKTPIYTLNKEGFNSNIKIIDIIENKINNLSI